MGKVTNAGSATVSVGLSENNGVISFDLPPTDGATGAQMVERLVGRGCHLGDYARELILSPAYVPTVGVVYHVRVLRMSLYSAQDRTTGNVRVDAKRRSLLSPAPEAACLARLALLDTDLLKRQLGLMLFAHEPIPDRSGKSGLLGIHWLEPGQRLEGFKSDPGCLWHWDDSIAFVTPP